MDVPYELAVSQLKKYSKMAKYTEDIPFIANYVTDLMSINLISC